MTRYLARRVRGAVAAVVGRLARREPARHAAPAARTVDTYRQRLTDSLGANMTDTTRNDDTTARKAIAEPGTRPTFTRPAGAGDASPLRHVRVPDSVWVAACERAAAEGLRVSAVVRELLRSYAAGDTPDRVGTPLESGVSGADGCTLQPALPDDRTAPHRTETDRTDGTHR